MNRNKIISILSSLSISTNIILVKRVDKLEKQIDESLSKMHRVELINLLYALNKPINY